MSCHETHELIVYTLFYTNQKTKIEIVNKYTEAGLLGGVETGFIQS